MPLEYVDSSNLANSSLIRDYIDMAIANYVQAAGIDIELGYQITTEVPIYNFNENQIIGYAAYLIVDDVVMGEINVFESDNDHRLFSVFSTEVSKPITDLLSEDLAFCFGGYNEALLLVDEDKICCLNDKEFDTFDRSVVQSRMCVNPNQRIFVSRGEVLQQHILTGSEGTIYGSRNISGISHVTNNYTNAYNDGKGICWAACIAMKVNYKKGKTYTAADVYDYLKNANYPYDGSIGCASLAYSHYGVPMSYGARKTGNFIWEQLGANNPLDLCIKGARCKDSSMSVKIEDAYHQVLITGMSVHSNGVTYRIMDPNPQGEQFVFIEGKLPTLLDNNFETLNYVDTRTYKNGNVLKFTETYRLYW